MLYELRLYTSRPNPALCDAATQDAFASNFSRLAQTLKIAVVEARLDANGVVAVLRGPRELKATATERKFRSRLDRLLRDAMPSLGNKRLWLIGEMVATDGGPSAK